ncbi:MAG: exodeoxyribonuclease III [Gammaproteobacteria bacterium]|nr:exodeoxyribonuclease III [Gammaproteobacteria bacterium]
MKIVSFNTNSIRLRLHQLQKLADDHNPDVIGIQETKVVDEDFPFEEIKEIGFYAECFGQKTHYGVAMLSKNPMQEVKKGFSTDPEDAQRRMISATVTSDKGSEVRVLNGYFPQGENRSHEVKFPAKEKFYQDLLAELESEYNPKKPLALIGDFNVAPVDNDLGIGPDNVKRWLRNGSTCFLPEERQWLQTLFDWGLDDSFRVKYPDVDDLFSWFDYRSKGFDRDPKRGLRIDHILTTKPLTQKLQDSGIDYDIRAMEKPSDHCPAWSSFDI